MGLFSKLRCTVILALLATIVSSHSQPWPIKVETVGLCCGAVSSKPVSVYDYNATEVGNLKGCLNRQGNKAGREPVTIITYAAPGTGDFSIPEIEQFSVYQHAVVAAYAENNRYTYRNIDENLDTGGFDGTVDSRWYKIKLLLDALETYAQNDRFIVWLDADAVVLDFGLRIEELGAQHPTADVLASADIRMGLINTGVLVLRNTPWLRRFLQSWWHGPPGGPSDREWRAVCDQDAFDRLYSHYAAMEAADPTITDKISGKVKVLAMDALNSHPPAMLHQQEHNPVLHLMGEATAMRRELFRTAWSNSICGARSGGVLPLQLGLNREVILSFARIVYGEEVMRLLEGVRNVSALPMHSISGDGAQLEALLVAPLTELSTAAHHFCDILQHLHGQQQQDHIRRRLTPQEAQSAGKKKDRYQREQLALRRDLLELVLARVSQVKDELTRLSDSAEHGRRSAMLAILVQLIKRAAEAGNDVFGAAVTGADKLQAAGTVFELLEELESLVDEDSRFVPLHMQALMHQNLGLMEHNLALSLAAAEPLSTEGAGVHAKALVDSHLQEAAKHLSSSVAIFSKNKQSAGARVAEDSTSLMEESLSLQLLAGVTCSLGKYREGVRLWANAIAQARQSLRGLQLGVRYDNLAGVLYNAAVCNHAAQKVDQAAALVKETISMLSRGDRDGGSEGSTLLQAARGLQSALEGASVPEKPTATHSAAISRAQEASPLIMRPVAGAEGGPRTYVRASPPTVVAQNVVSVAGEQTAVQEEEEWVECELDEDCEYFDVLETEAPEAPNTPPHQLGEEHRGPINNANKPSVQTGGAQGPTSVSAADADVLEGVDIEGMSAEEVEELREVRARYARQAAQRLDRASHAGQVIHEQISEQMKLELQHTASIPVIQAASSVEQQEPTASEVGSNTHDACAPSTSARDIPTSRALAAIEDSLRLQQVALVRLEEQVRALQEENRDVKAKLETCSGSRAAESVGDVFFRWLRLR